MPNKGGARGQRNGAGKGSQPPFEEDPDRKADADGPGAGHNASDRDKALAAAIERDCDLQDQEDALMAKWIEPIRKKKAKNKADLKSEYDIPTQSFNARAALRRIERSEDNDEVVLATQALFDALPVGHNLDLVAIAERVAAKKKAEAEKAAAKSKAKVEEHAVN